MVADQRSSLGVAADQQHSVLKTPLVVLHSPQSDSTTLAVKIPKPMGAGVAVVLTAACTSSFLARWVHRASGERP